MFVTRKVRVPGHWVFFAQIPFVVAIFVGVFSIGPTFLYTLKKFIDNPALIAVLLAVDLFIIGLGSPFVNWLSDRIWTRLGRRRPFVAGSLILKALVVSLMPFAPNLITLMCLRWAFFILEAVGAPNQPLTMEVVPSAQRGLGNGYFQMQIQAMNLVFYYLVLGRFDDVYFSGPLQSLTALPGEALTFYAAAIMALAMGVFTWFGYYEVQPPTYRRLRDERRDGESVLRLFLRSFFSDLFHRSLVPLYLLLTASAMFNVQLGVLGPLLFTDQWGYTLQQMGTNVAISAVIGIGIAMIAGWVADRLSKTTVYTLGLAGVLVTRILWTIYVDSKPNDRPELFEIVIQGAVYMIFATMTQVAMLPLLMEFVERNRLGTASAGMGLFQNVTEKVSTAGVGLLVLGWSMLFLPQAGDQVLVVFKEEKDTTAIVTRLESAGLPAKTLNIKPEHRPGKESATSRQWSIRRSDNRATELHKQLKDVETELTEQKLRLVQSGTDPGSSNIVNSNIVALNHKKAEIEERLKSSTIAFETEVRRAFAGDLVPVGTEIIAAAASGDSSQLSVTLNFAEPVDAKISKLPAFVNLLLPTGTNEPQTIIEALAAVLMTDDLSQSSPDSSDGTGRQVRITEVPGYPNALTIEIVRDKSFVILENALSDAGAAPTEAFGLASRIIRPIRSLSGNDQTLYSVAGAQASLDVLEFDLVLRGPVLPPPSVLIDALSTVSGVATVAVNRSASEYHVVLRLSRIGEASGAISDIGRRLHELLPQATPQSLRALELFADRVIETAATSPVFLTAARPVVFARTVDREYDYFFPTQYLMITADIFALMVIGLIVYLERGGKIVRAGVIEDVSRTEAIQSGFGYTVSVNADNNDVASKACHIPRNRIAKILYIFGGFAVFSFGLLFIWEPLGRIILGETAVAVVTEIRVSEPAKPERIYNYRRDFPSDGSHSTIYSHYVSISIDGTQMLFRLNVDSRRAPARSLNVNDRVLVAYYRDDPDRLACAVHEERTWGIGALFTFVGLVVVGTGIPMLRAVGRPIVIDPEVL